MDDATLAVGLLATLAKGEQSRVVLDAVDAAGSLGLAEIEELERAESVGEARFVVRHEAAARIRSKGLVSITVLDEKRWIMSISAKGAVALAWIQERERA